MSPISPNFLVLFINDYESYSWIKKLPKLSDKKKINVDQSWCFNFNNVTMMLTKLKKQKCHANNNNNNNNSDVAYKVANYLTL